MVVDTLRGSPDTQLSDVRHLVVPSRGRNPLGTELGPVSAERTRYASEVYNSLQLYEKRGVIICMGNAAVGDTATRFSIPEAILMQRYISTTDIVQDPLERVLTEVNGTDTATQFVNIQDFFPDRQPVGIVAQRAHLERILKHIAPIAMHQPFIGIIAPEVPGVPDIDDPKAARASRRILSGLEKELRDPFRENNLAHAKAVAQQRANRIYRLIVSPVGQAWLQGRNAVLAPECMPSNGVAPDRTTVPPEI